jgi:hypothetical protein
MLPCLLYLFLVFKDNFDPLSRAGMQELNLQPFSYLCLIQTIL